ncbi:MAG: ClpXP protease specificity-enhancing factor [Thiothrix sp.]|nr:ClpXP protease specificity-enhancing factor [Thiothrix sp.]HPQ95291.1 ClpXP protease specificity-enhancing factor [Thiolinea sp.]
MSTTTRTTTPKRPYLLRAFYDWIVDNGMTPHIVVDATLADVEVPRRYVRDGRIVLNIHPGAVGDFVMDNSAVSFTARFSGVAHYLYCPMPAVIAIYARETPNEMVSFPETEYDGTGEAPEDAGGSRRPGLSAVDSPDQDAALSPEPLVDEPEADGQGSDSRDDDDLGEDNPPPRSRPSLRVVK